MLNTQGYPLFQYRFLLYVYSDFRHKASCDDVIDSASGRRAKKSPDKINIRAEFPDRKTYKRCSAETAGSISKAHRSSSYWKRL
jgi:hypothetical protein